MNVPVVAVACSGGRDSMALLHATVQSAAIHGWRVIALHVHHGLSPNADDWVSHIRRQCVRWARRGLPVGFDTERLVTAPASGESIEAWARTARYDALGRLARANGAGIVLLAHHRRDQAETLLLQALRGAGTAGLSAMPVDVERDGITWARPWLAMSREAIEAYVRRHRVSFVEDESNVDERYARNRLRRSVWPALVKAFPDAEASVARSAAWSQEASACLAELAVIDLVDVAPDGQLDLSRWSALSLPRRSNVLRAWLRRCLSRSAPASLIVRLLDELPDSTTGAVWAAGQGALRRQGHRLTWALVHAPAALASRDDTMAASVRREDTLAIRRAGRIDLPGWGGSLRASRVREGGVPLAWLARLDLRERSGGERFQAGFDRPPRSLKKQFQAAGLGAWQRGGPLVFSGGLLVFVPGLGIDARMIGLRGQPQLSLAWEPTLPA